MSGFMEILLIVLIVLVIFLLPRMMNRRQSREPQVADQGARLTGWMRLAILASLLWPALAALYIKPWEHQWPIFFYVAMGPLVLTWGLYWVFTGFKKRKE